MRAQAEAAGLRFARVYFGCGSGGTAAGLALAHALSGWAEEGCERWWALASTTRPSSSSRR